MENQTIESDLTRQIFVTIKKLNMIGETIKWHQARERPDKVSISEWQEVHADFTQQLVAMLAEVGVNVQVPTKTLEHA
jgi:hypothetical protein